MTELTTPTPKKRDNGCPYRREIERVRVWQAQGLDELVVVHRRRDRLTLVLAGAALTIAVTLSTAALAGGWSLARSVGQAETRLETLEQARPLSREALIQLGRLEARIEGLETRLGERLEGIERRMDRMEAANRRDQ
jgi:hypothetical protein